ncbi:MAG: hypothetical protein GTN40_01760 [Candidatus Aenigmarchaeota archaeon]|nr:hypothetical protein [Candidatus Aenigmarchaeota archaeon]
MEKSNLGFSKPFIIIVVALIAAGLAGAGVWYWQQQQIKKLGEFYKKPSPIKKVTSSPTLSPTPSPTATTTPDETAGWLTYTNTEVGYTLKYPSGWTIKETSTYSELIGKNVKYITITTPDGKYFLYLGIKGLSGDYEISDRTGIGAGDWVADGSITILETSITKTNLVYGGKVKEIFYPQSIQETSDGNYEFWATFSYKDIPDYDSLDMTTVTFVSDVEKILKTISLF